MSPSEFVKFVEKLVTGKSTLGSKDLDLLKVTLGKVHGSLEEHDAD